MHFDPVTAKLVLFVGFQCTFLIPLFWVRNFCFGVFWTSTYFFIWKFLVIIVQRCPFSTIWMMESYITYLLCGPLSTYTSWPCRPVLMYSLQAPLVRAGKISQKHVDFSMFRFLRYSRWKRKRARKFSSFSYSANVKMVTGYKRKTDAFHFPHGSFLLISRHHFDVQRSTTYC